MMIVHDLAVCDFPEVFGIRQIPELMAYLDYYVIANAAWMSKLRLQLILCWNPGNAAPTIHTLLRDLT